MSSSTADGFALSFAQQRLWFAHQLAPDSIAYNMYEAYRLLGPLDLDVLQTAVTSTVARHETLRTTFQSSRGVPHQVIGEPSVVVEEVADLDVVIGRSFALDRDPPLRVAVRPLGPDDHVLLVVMHHIVSDEQSMTAFWRDLSEFYRAQVTHTEAELAPLPVRYVDYAAWQRDWLSGGLLADELDHWRRELAGAPPVLELPADHPRPARQSDNRGTTSFTLPPSTVHAIGVTSRAVGATPFMTCLAAFAALLSKAAPADDVVIGTFAANRPAVEVEAIVGLFVNTLPLRVRVGTDPTFEDLLSTVRMAATDGIRHQEVPFDQVVTAMRPPRDLSRNPVVQVAFQSLQPLTGRVALPGVTATPHSAGQCGDPFDIRVSLRGAEGELHYAADLFTAETAAALAGWYVRIVTAAAESPTLRTTQLPQAH
ncbi:condensation domain-containing protein [Amycolatopsis sp. PS_44_ISF1]|uniref:condensation domain-containing protein n=1 Tax=Amycolatopsis sp. PS_44_ISF1 TaxID=2974917 RepID=UPI0028DED41E|nr:condensation domain-containing protein [Amycolatopsis sp. PS_44_ISF1]MDT8912932.1 condensation domain-containing protein [Amycolatopsis sp. PS_44_ISF1]